MIFHITRGAELQDLIFNPDYAIENLFLLQITAK